MKILSFAKINLGLKVNKKRLDGFHDLDMIVQSVDLYDILHISIIDDPGKIEVSCNKFICEEESNLAYKSAKVMFDIFHPNFGIKIYIEKNIPFGAGLGGGSSNAAAVILCLNHVLKLNLSYEQKINISSKIGSDVPFFMFGGTLQCQGRGEIIKHIDQLPECNILIREGKNKSFTSDAYKKLDDISYFDSSDQRIENLKNSIKLKDINSISDNCFNDFEKIISVPDGWHLTGSGSASFKIINKNFTSLDDAYIICKPVNYGVKIIENNWN